MGKVLLDMAVSLDGYIDGPDGADVGLYDWYAEMSGPNANLAAEVVDSTGAIVIGRGAFGRGDDATGWDETPYEVPHFVVTHRPPRAASAGPVDFRFVEGVREAVTAAREAAGDRYATIGGGADVARQALDLGLVDEVQLHLVPVIVGAGTLLFAPGCAGWRLSPVRVVQTPEVTHLRYRVEGPRVAAEG
jgi:dihydrofolate reductase